MSELIFYASIVNHNGKPALLLRKILTNKEDIRNLVSEIVEKGKYEFKGVLIFRNTFLSIKALEEAGLI